jgi:hypothetical protein
MRQADRNYQRMRQADRNYQMLGLSLMCGAPYLQLAMAIELLLSALWVYLWRGSGATSGCVVVDHDRKPSQSHEKRGRTTLHSFDLTLFTHLIALTWDDRAMHSLQSIYAAEGLAKSHDVIFAGCHEAQAQPFKLLLDTDALRQSFVASKCLRNRRMKHVEQ